MSSYEKYSVIRDKAGITDYRVAKDNEMATSTLSDWKNGISSPKVDKLKKLSEYFNVSIEYFLD